MRYTALLEPMSLQPIRRLFATVLICLVCLAAQAQNEPETIWTRPARQLVAEVLERAASPSSVAFDVENRAGMTPADLQQIRKALDIEFRNAKTRVVRNEAAVAEVRFILSRNPRGLLWIAQAKQGTSEQFSMIEFADPTAFAADRRAAMFQLQRTRLISSPGPILDVAPMDGDLVLALGSEQISLFRRDHVSNLLIPHSSSWPRDQRGRLFVTGDTFSAFLPGVHCTGTVRPTFAVECMQSDDPWPLLRPGANEPAAFFGSARNHFSGVLGGALAGVTIPPFYSAARLGDSDPALWAFSGIDGNTRFYQRPAQLLRTATSLGSDLAAVKSGCGAGWQLVVTGDGDETKPDTLQAFEMQNREAIPVSEKLSFEGPITALWSSPDAARAMVVVRNLQKEVYDAYSVAIICR